MIIMLFTLRRAAHIEHERLWLIDIHGAMHVTLGLYMLWVRVAT